MNGIYSFQASTHIYMGEYVSIDGFGKVAPANPGTNIQIVGYAMNTVEEGEMCQILMRGLDFISEKGHISFYAPKNPTPYENLEFEFDLKSGKPKTPIFGLIFEGTARTFREVPMESQRYHYLDRDDYFLHPYNPDEPIEFHDHYAVANYKYNCTADYNPLDYLFRWRESHYEFLLCVFGKNTYVFQEAHIKFEKILENRIFQSLSFTIYAEQRELILHEEALHEKTDPRFNIELGECDRSLPSNEFDIEI